MTTIYCKSETIWLKAHAVALATLAGLKTLEPDLDFQVPKVTFLRDTTPMARQWKREKNYYGQSLHGTDWPDRWLCEEEPYEKIVA